MQSSNFNYDAMTNAQENDAHMTEKDKKEELEFSKKSAEEFKAFLKTLKKENVRITRFNNGTVDVVRYEVQSIPQHWRSISEAQYNSLN